MIALPRVLGAHSGANIAAALMEVLEKYEIADKLGYMMLDNATNNDTAVEALQDALISKLGTVPTISAEERRLRCFGHILNLVVKAMLFGTDEARLEMSKEDLLIWRKIGPVGKLHNVV
jgi:hypothetical protein